MRKIIEGDVNLSELFLTKLLDLSDIEVTGSYNCSTNALNSLKGSPHTVGNRFSCFKSGATSLVGIPKTIGKCFYIDRELKDKFTFKYIRSLSDIKGDIVYIITY